MGSPCLVIALLLWRQRESTAEENLPVGWLSFTYVYTHVHTCLRIPHADGEGKGPISLSSFDFGEAMLAFREEPKILTLTVFTPF